MSKRKVFIINTDYDTSRMFTDNGWEIVASPDEADMFQFTGSGSSDVSPELYRESCHKTTHPDRARDKKETAFFHIAKKLKIPMAGICRGAQLLNVMNGGWLWQNVNNHNVPHYITDQITGDTYLVSSAHHQAMRVQQNGHGIVLATTGRSTFREWCSKTGTENTVYVNPKKESDVEAVLYPDTKCLCIQWHPEYKGWESTQARYFDMIEAHLFPKD